MHHMLFAHPVHCAPGCSCSLRAAFIWLEKGCCWICTCLLSLPRGGCWVLAAPSAASSGFYAGKKALPTLNLAPLQNTSAPELIASASGCKMVAMPGLMAAMPNLNGQPFNGCCWPTTAAANYGLSFTEHKPLTPLCKHHT